MNEINNKLYWQENEKRKNYILLIGLPVEKTETDKLKEHSNKFI